METQVKSLSEIPLQAPTGRRKKRVMVAGIGNMFLKDDGFGGAVVRKLLEKERREGVEIRDFGTGGLKLAYDLMQGYDAVILIDAAQRGEKPGTLYVIEPDQKDFASDVSEGGPIDPHGADPLTILRFVKAVDAWPPRVLVIGCEPSDVQDFHIGLSDSVRNAVEDAVRLVESTIEEVCA